MGSCQTINIFWQPAIRSIVQRVAIGMTGAETKKDINNLSDYQCLSFDFRVISPVSVEMEVTDPYLLMSLIFLMFQNAVLQLVSVFDH